MQQLKQLLTISIVSHNNNKIVTKLLDKLKKYPEVYNIVITHNIPEADVIIPAELKYRVKILRNSKTKGYGENHNYAFRYCDTQFFCILNPDVIFINNPFQNLIKYLNKNDSIALVAPIILNDDNKVEDSYREFPTPGHIIDRILGLKNNNPVSYSQVKKNIYPEWIAGMFMLFKSRDFQHVGGFDEGFFMYCEDVDICLRLRTNNKVLVVSHLAYVIHDARRESRNNFWHMIWHIQSMIRLWVKYLGRLPK